MLDFCQWYQIASYVIKQSKLCSISDKFLMASKNALLDWKTLHVANCIRSICWMNFADDEYLKNFAHLVKFRLRKFYWETPMIWRSNLKHFLLQLKCQLELGLKLSANFLSKVLQRFPFLPNSCTINLVAQNLKSSSWSNFFTKI